MIVSLKKTLSFLSNYVAAFCSTRWMRSSTTVNIKDLFNTPHSTRIKTREGDVLAIVCSAALPSVCFHGWFNFLWLKKESKASKTFPTLKIKWYQTGTAGTAANHHCHETLLLKLFLELFQVSYNLMPRRSGIPFHNMLGVVELLFYTTLVKHPLLLGFVVSSKLLLSDLPSYMCYLYAHWMSVYHQLWLPKALMLWSVAQHHRLF